VASPSNDSECANDNLKIDDIKIKYHPSSDRQPDIFHFDNFYRQWPMREPTIDPKPWKPFCTHIYFEFAELMLESHMNTGQSVTLLSLIQKAIVHPEDLTISSTDDLENAWDDARKTRAAGVSIRFC
jgi:hypothetical protein